jgi:hypothetical protein
MTFFSHWFQSLAEDWPKDGWKLAVPTMSVRFLPDCLTGRPLGRWLRDKHAAFQRSRRNHRQSPVIAGDSLVLIALYDQDDILRYANASFRSAYHLAPSEQLSWGEIMRRCSLIWPGMPTHLYGALIVSAG